MGFAFVATAPADPSLVEPDGWPDDIEYTGPPATWPDGWPYPGNADVSPPGYQTEYTFTLIIPTSLTVNGEFKTDETDAVGLLLDNGYPGYTLVNRLFIITATLNGAAVTFDGGAESLSAYTAMFMAGDYNGQVGFSKAFQIEVGEDYENGDVIELTATISLEAGEGAGLSGLSDSDDASLSNVSETLVMSFSTGINDISDTLTLALKMAVPFLEIPTGLDGLEFALSGTVNEETLVFSYGSVYLQDFPPLGSSEDPFFFAYDKESGTTPLTKVYGNVGVRTLTSLEITKPSGDFADGDALTIQVDYVFNEGDPGGWVGVARTFEGHIVEAVGEGKLYFVDNY